MNTKIIEELIGFMDAINSISDKLKQLEKSSPTEAKTPKFLSSDEAAAFIGVSKRTLYNYRIQPTKLPFHQIGRKILYSERDLMAFANRFRVGHKINEELI
ncbi:helix-turn-helix domain-containing protein [bacterium]|nr:helix-turn-helix domain-containing protein [bacterium]